ncbi:MAG: serine hydrolase [Ferruginibacter sp.]
MGLDSTRLSILDSIAADAISKGATPGCVVLVARNGRIAYEKAYGNFNYGFYEPVDTGTIYDMASVTKVCATTLSLMKLYDEGKLDLQKRLGDYLPWTRGSDKENIKVEDMLLHQGGLVAYIPFYKEMISPAGVPLSKYFSPTPEAGFGIRVAENLYMRTDWRDTIYKRILQSPLGQEGRYIYSDNDFIFLGKIVEAISGLPLDEYVQQNFYQPLGLLSTGFKPRERFPLTRVAPTEDEKYFRLQHLHGDVHDPGAALFGGVSGHAGLFSNAHDLAVIMEMLVDGGSFNGKQYIKKETIRLFSSYHSPISRRGYGFDKPEKDNTTRPEPYPCLSNSPYTFGHTGFTGTCVWADPASRFVFIFLSNRVNPEGGDNKRLLNLNVRGKMMEAVYQAMIW